ncbi:hypothetical protein Tco_1303259 [Tanacetum coccineum]
MSKTCPVYCSSEVGSMEFFVPGAVNVTNFFPISVKFKAASTFSNLQLAIVPSKKQSVPPEFVHHRDLEIQEYTIYG